jgi:nucleotide-binding universal stress UspA family protein
MGLRILIGIDNSVFAQRAIGFGIELAKISGSTLVGICAVDVYGIEKHAAGASPGAFYYAEKLVDDKINDSRTKLEKLLDEFENKCRTHNIACEKILRSGTPAKEIIKETELADLLLIGIKTYFHFETTDDSDDTFEKIISHGKCPIIAVTEKEIPVNMGTLIAYDGNAKSNNAMKAFARVNDYFKFSKEVTVLNVNDNLEEGDAIIQKAHRYLQSHGLKVTGKILQGRPREIIYKTAKELENICKTLLVIGTNGNNELTDYIVGNSIRSIVQDGTIPLFICH